MLNNGLLFSVAPGFRQRLTLHNCPKNRWLKIVLAIALLLICVTAQKAESSSWYSGTPLLTARDQFTGGVINGKIYVFGGNGDPNGLDLKSTEVFDPATSQWSYLANNEHNAGNGVEELSGAVVNNKLYVFGGYGGPNGVINFVEEYNPVTNTWASKTSMPTTRSSAPAAAYNGEIYVFGGYLPNDQRSTIVEAFNPTANTWRSVTNIPVSNLEGFVVAVVGSKAFVMGGFNGSNMLNTVMTYDFATNVWSTTGYTPLPTPRVFPYAAALPVINGKIYLIGGIIGNKQSYSECSVVEIYDTATNTWSTDASFPAPLASHLSLALNGTIYVAGGNTDHTDSGSIRTNAVWKREILSQGDLNSDGTVNLTDTIMALQVMSGMNPTGIRSITQESGMDINNDKKIGLAEAIYSLQDIAGLRVHPFGISGWWDLYVPAIQARKVDAYYLRQTGSAISGANILAQPIAGNISGTAISLTLPPGGDTLDGILSGDTITGVGFKEGMGEFIVNIVRSTFHFTNFYPGESISSTGAHFAWTTSSGAEKYFIRVMKDNAQHNCNEAGGCAGIWEKDGIIGTSVSFNDDSTASEQLMPGNNYRVRVYSRLNSQTGMPLWDNPNTFIDTTMDVAFKVNNGPFVDGDFQGTWNYKGIVSGNTSAGQLPGWLYGTMTFDSSGNATSTPIIDSAGTASYTPTMGKMNIDSRGIITPTLDSAGRWIMTSNKNLMMFVGTGALGSITGVRGYNLFIAAKTGGNFIPSDLHGTWNWHCLSSGSGTQNGWAYGTLTVNEDGSSIMNYFNSNGQQNSDSSGTVLISSSGIVTLTPDSNGFHGVMSSDKSMIISTMNDGGGGYDLMVFTKSGGTFSTTDLQGSWNINMLASGQSPQWTGWGYGSGTCDSNGQFSWSSIGRSDGNSTLPGSGNISISSNGIVTFPNMPTFHGIMSRNKDAIIGTMTDGGGGYGLMIFSRTANAMASDFVGTWKGTLNFNASDGESGSFVPTIILNKNGEFLTGTMDFDSVNGPVTNGIFSFSIPNSDPSNQDCVNWNMPATAILDSTMNSMIFKSSGMVCGAGGGKSGTVTGVLSKQASSFATIVIDGSFTDWTPLSVLFNSQIGNFKFSHDNNMVYVLFDMNNTISNSTYYQVGLYKDAHLTDGYDLRIYNNTAVIRRYVNGISTSFVANGSVAVGTNKIEASFAMSDMGISNGSIIWIRPHTYNTTQTNMGNYTPVILR